MAYKTITNVVTELDLDPRAMEAAVALARRNDAHLDVLCLGVDHNQPGFYYAGASIAELQSNIVDAQNHAADLEAKITARLQSEDINWTTHSLAAQSAGLARYLALHIRFSDIAVLPRPYGEGRGHEHEAIVESCLFDAKVPVLVIPPRFRELPSVKKIVVAWNESDEALTAIRHAIPLLRDADEVDITIIDPPAHAPNRSDPGGAISRMLSRHGVHVDISVLPRNMPRTSDVLAQHAKDVGADLIVMGAYGHSRFRESILGGSTRNMLEEAEIPVLMAH